MFLTMLIGGRDYGQLRPGLATAAASRAATDPVAVAAADLPAEPAPAAVVAASVTPQPAAVVPLVLPLVQEPAAEPAAAPEPEPSPLAEVWYVDARSVNVRAGPSTDSSVLGRLTRGEAATVIAREGEDWAHIIIEGDGIEGYVAARFLTRDAPSY